MDHKEIAGLFGITEISSLTELTDGHINDTFMIESGSGKYVLQSINKEIFLIPSLVMRNIEMIQGLFSGVTDIAIPEYLKCGGRLFADVDGQIWRAYRYSESTEPYSAYKHGYAVGAFIRTVNSGNVRVHSSPWTEHPAFDGEELPMRNIHGDTKASNIVFGEPLTMLDLDTIHYGTVLVDYGDMIRSVTTEGFDGKKVYDATKGFSDGLDGMLTSEEIAGLPRSVLMIIQELSERYSRGKKCFPKKTDEECRTRSIRLLEQYDTIGIHFYELDEIVKTAFAVYK